ncbi:MAG: Rieske (2Fe-2S) domain protein [Paenibacillus sp.]|nr:Rieske (2Fe-2S) domain protein [Paenibacillus sp.]
MKETVVGFASELKTLPKEITIDGELYYLNKAGEQDEYVLLSSTCPHAGGTVMSHENMLYCPLHMWTFDSQTGQCLNASSYCLDSWKVEAREDGRLVVFLAV